MYGNEVYWCPAIPFCEFLRLSQIKARAADRERKGTTAGSDAKKIRR